MGKRHVSSISMFLVGVLSHQSAVHAGPMVAGQVVELQHRATGKYLAPSEEHDEDRKGSGQKLVVAIDRGFEMGRKDVDAYRRWIVGGSTPGGQLVKDRSIVSFNSQKFQGEYLHSHGIYIKNRGQNRLHGESGDDGYEVTRCGGFDNNSNWILHGPFDNDAVIIQHAGHWAFLNSHYGATLWADIDKKVFEHVTEMLQLVRCIYDIGQRNDNFFNVIPVSAVNPDLIKEWNEAPTRSGRRRFKHSGDILNPVVAFNDGWKVKTPDRGVIRWRASGKGDMYLVLSSKKYDYLTFTDINAPVKGASDYRIAIGYDTNKEFLIVRNDDGEVKTVYSEKRSSNPQLMITGGEPFKGEELDTYWLLFDEGTILFGKGDKVGEDPLIEFEDQNALANLEYVGIGGGKYVIEYHDITFGTISSESEEEKPVLEAPVTHLNKENQVQKHSQDKVVVEKITEKAQGTKKQMQKNQEPVHKVKNDKQAVEQTTTISSDKKVIVMPNTEKNKPAVVAAK